MAEFTTNYNLEKPAQNEFYDVDVQNRNMDKIEQALTEAGNNPQLEADVTEIKTEMGNTQDTGGSESGGSVFAKLNKIIHDILGMIANIGNTADAGATETSGTLMGKTNALLKGVGGKITSGNKKYSPILYEQLVMVDKSPILGSQVNTNDLITNPGFLVVGDNYMYAYQRYSTSSYRIISISLNNGVINNGATGVYLSNDMSLKKCKNDTHLFYPYGASSVYKIDHRTNINSSAFNISGATIDSMVAANDVVYIHDKTSHKIMAYSATETNTKLRESAVIGTAGGTLALNGSYLVYLESSSNSIYLLNSQNLSLLATISTSYIHDVFSYGEDFLCTSDVVGYTKILRVNKVAPSSSNLENFSELKYHSIQDLDYLPDGSIMLYSNYNVLHGAVHMIISPSGEITRLSDNHDYLNLRFGPTCIDKNTGYIYKMVTSFIDIDPGPYEHVMYIGKFIKKYVVVGYDLEV